MFLIRVFCVSKGALHLVDDMRVIVQDMRREINQESRIKRTVARDLELDIEADVLSTIKTGKSATPSCIHLFSIAKSDVAPSIVPRANVKVEMPRLPNAARRAALSSVKGMLVSKRLLFHAV